MAMPREVGKFADVPTGDAACDGWGWPKGWHRGMALRICIGSMHGYGLKMRKRDDRRKGSGRAWMAGRVGGGRPEAALRVLARRCCNRASWLLKSPPWEQGRVPDALFADAVGRPLCPSPPNTNKNPRRLRRRELRSVGSIALSRREGSALQITLPKKQRA